MSKLSIVYATDDNYAQHVAVSILSIYKTAQDISLYEFYILGNNLSTHVEGKLRKMLDSIGIVYNVIEISSFFNTLPIGIAIANLTISTYSRLFLAEILPKNIDKVLYLDCDTLIVRDISSLQDFPMGDSMICGVEDTMYPEMKIQIGLNKEDSYINAGVLLINLKKWRETSITIRFLDFIKKFNAKVPHLDQGVINGVLRNHQLLPLIYNVQSPIYAIHRYEDLLKFHCIDKFYSKEEVEQAKNSPTILHFTSFFVGRPWFRFCLHPKRNCYRELLKETPFFYHGLQKNKNGITRILRMLCFRYLQPIYLLLKFSIK
ncbi:MAG: General stress protein A [Bacteroidetes bacterium ADurb.Bin302]|jgi:lipopolysaccharide biosynthesis glycosyltransferase|nr:MAG: General stress protein A [Bacteroidetes bacterium ADurb.Bin302]